MSEAYLMVEVAYAEPYLERIRPVRVARGACVEDALQIATLDPDLKDVDLANCAVGIFGKVVPREQLLEEGDRIEIYRPLTQDPKEARRARAREADKQRRRESARGP